MDAATRVQFEKSLMDYNKDLLSISKNETITTLTERGFTVKESARILNVLSKLEIAFETDGYNGLHDEVITYGLTNKEFARYLHGLESTAEKDESKTFWSKLVDIILYTVNRVFDVSKA